MDLNGLIRITSRINIKGYDATTDEERQYYLEALGLIRNSELSVFKTGGNVSIIRMAAFAAAGRDNLKEVSYIALHGDFACLIIDVMVKR